MIAAISPVVERNITLTMTETEAKMLAEIAGMNITIPAALRSQWTREHADQAEKVLQAVFQAITYRK